MADAPPLNPHSRPLRLWGYWRSSSSWRVRIALALKGLAYESVPLHLIRNGGEQNQATYRERNPQQLVPLLEHGEFRLQQSLAICEYLDSIQPHPRLVPEHPELAAQTRALAQMVACEIQPLNNLRVLQYLEQQLHVEPYARSAWYRHWIATGFDALQDALPEPHSAFAMGDSPTLVDVVLIPQLYNARRFHTDLSSFPRLTDIESRCLALPAFATTAPEQQTEAE